MTSLPPALTFAFTATVQLAAPIDLGNTEGVQKRLVPIVGGRVSGPRLNGVILPGGGDWQSVLPDGMTRVFARYTLEAADGTHISVANRGIRRGPAEILKRMAAGEQVDRNAYYFRTAPQFDVGAGPHRWLAETVFICSAARLADQALIDFYSVS
jgi:Protein of unknown function (DUF3237)